MDIKGIGGAVLGLTGAAVLYPTGPAEGFAMSLLMLAIVFPLFVFAWDSKRTERKRRGGK